mmetsp:Transcript_10885/g.16528  ORF Transcript_10885/g.16528 Transcript_10885/m.16528 type:complete len:120 (-) Transcript_10885:134-493(-)
MLFSIDGLRKAVVSFESFTKLKEPKAKLGQVKLSLYQIQRVFSILTNGLYEGGEEPACWFSSRSAFSPKAFRSTLPSYFQSFHQQDVSEFAKILLDKLETEEIDLLKPTLPEGEEIDKS